MLFIIIIGGILVLYIYIYIYIHTHKIRLASNEIFSLSNKILGVRATGIQKYMLMF